VITKELPAGTGILLATATSTPSLESLVSTVRLTELSVLLAKVPPIKIVLVPEAEVNAVVGPRKLTVLLVVAAVLVESRSTVTELTPIIVTFDPAIKLAFTTKSLTPMPVVEIPVIKLVVIPIEPPVAVVTIPAALVNELEKASAIFLNVLSVFIN